MSLSKMFGKKTSTDKAKSMSLVKSRDSLNASGKAIPEETGASHNYHAEATKVSDAPVVSPSPILQARRVQAATQQIVSNLIGSITGSAEKSSSFDSLSDSPKAKRAPTKKGISNITKQMVEEPKDIIDIYASISQHSSPVSSPVHSNSVSPSQTYKKSPSHPSATKADITGGNDHDEYHIPDQITTIDSLIPLQSERALKKDNLPPAFNELNTESKSLDRFDSPVELNRSETLKMAQNNIHMSPTDTILFSSKNSVKSDAVAIESLTSSSKRKGSSSTTHTQKMNPIGADGLGALEEQEVDTDSNEEEVSSTVSALPRTKTAPSHISLGIKRVSILDSATGSPVDLILFKNDNSKGNHFQDPSTIMEDDLKEIPKLSKQLTSNMKGVVVKGIEGFQIDSTFHKKRGSLLSSGKSEPSLSLPTSFTDGDLKNTSNPNLGAIIIEYPLSQKPTMQSGKSNSRQNSTTGSNNSVHSITPTIAKPEKQKNTFGSAPILEIGELEEEEQVIKIEYPSDKFKVRGLENFQVNTFSKGKELLSSPAQPSVDAIEGKQTKKKPQLMKMNIPLTGLTAPDNSTIEPGQKTAIMENGPQKSFSEYPVSLPTESVPSRSKVSSALPIYPKVGISNLSPSTSSAANGPNIHNLPTTIMVSPSGVSPSGGNLSIFDGEGMNEREVAYFSKMLHYILVSSLLPSFFEGMQVFIDTTITKSDARILSRHIAAYNG